MDARLLGAAIATAIVIVFGSPYVGSLRAAIQAAFPDHYRTIIGGAVAVSAVACVVFTVLRVRNDYARRYSLLAAAASVAIASVFAMRTGQPDQDVVELFHFVEYGVLTMCFYAAWRREPDVTAVLFPAVAAMSAGIADEWFQWFVPSRVGEMRDVMLNGVAVACGLLVSAAIAPPATLRLPVTPARRRAVAVAVVATGFAAAVFVHTVHVGHDILSGASTSFRSRFSPAQLAAIAAERWTAWQAAPPLPSPPLLSREDHYLSEAQFHIRRRNDKEAEGNLSTAWRENLILERYYAPVLAVAMPGSRWSPEQRAAIEAAAANDARPYVSDAYPFPIVVWSSWSYWAVVSVCLAALWIAFARRGRTAMPTVSV